MGYKKMCSLEEDRGPEFGQIWIGFHLVYPLQKKVKFKIRGYLVMENL